MRISPRAALRTLTGAAILGFGALVFSPAPAEAHGWWGRRHHHPGWHGGYAPYRPYVAPRPVYGYGYYAPSPRIVVAPPMPYYAPRPYATHYRGW